MADKYDFEKRDFASVCIFAMRYAMGRKTYAPSTVIRFIIRNFDNVELLDLKVMLKDIEEYELSYGSFGDECDNRDWQAFKKKLSEEISKREKAMP